MQPLADKIRPNTLDEVIGQSNLVGEGKVIRNMFNKGYIPNMIFYGPPGVGKTTVANLAAKSTNKKFYKLNATTAGVKDIQNIIPIKKDGKTWLCTQEYARKYTCDPEFPFLVSYSRTGSHWLRMIMELYFEKPILVRIFYFIKKRNFLCL